MKYLIKISILLLTLFVQNICVAQTGFHWAKRGGAPENSQGGGAESLEGEVEMVTDKNGNVYALANISKTNLPANIDGIVHPTLRNVRKTLTKWDCNGNQKWTKFFGGNSFSAPGSSLGLDSMGGIYFTGFLVAAPNSSSSSAFFDTDTTLSGTYKQWYIVKYDTNGVFQWLQMPQPDSVTNSLNGTANHTRGLALEVAPNGDLFIFSHLAKGLYNSTFSNTQTGFYLMKYNKNGVFLDAKLLPITVETGSFGEPIFYNFENRNFGFVRNHNNGRFYVTNTYNKDYGEIKFGGQPIAYASGPGVLNTPAYIVAFDSSGNHLWTQQSKAEAGKGFNFIKNKPRLDESGNIYLSGGGKQGDVFCGHTINNTYSNLYMGLFLLSIDPDGNLRWGRNASSGNASNLCAIAYSKGIVAVSDAWYQHLSWGADTIGTGSYAGGGHLSKFNAYDGTPLSIDTITMTGDSYGMEDLTADNKGNFFMGGRFKSQLKIPNQTINNIGGTFDFFVVKNGALNCNCVLPIPDFSYANNILNVQFTYTGSTADSIYWSFGDGQHATGFSVNHNYAAQGVYKVNIVIYSKCGMQSFTKEVNIDETSISAQHPIDNVVLYPNPAVDYVMITNMPVNSNIRLINNIGQVIWNENNTASFAKITLLNMPAGLFIVEIMAENGSKKVLKFMKQ